MASGPAQTSPGNMSLPILIPKRNTLTHMQQHQAVSPTSPVMITRPRPSLQPQAALSHSNVSSCLSPRKMRSSHTFELADDPVLFIIVLEGALFHLQGFQTAPISCTLVRTTSFPSGDFPSPYPSHTEGCPSQASFQPPPHLHSASFPEMVLSPDSTVSWYNSAQ